jgi:predicted RND superfamily exporter protein
MWQRIARIVLRYRILLLVLIGLITIFMGTQVVKLQMDYHYANMLPETDPAFIDNVKFKNTFGEEANGIIVGIENPNFFNLDDFNALRTLCSNLKEIDHVTQVVSATQAFNLRQHTITGDDGKNKREFELYHLFPETLNSQKELDSLKNIFFDLPFYKNLLYNDTANVYLLMITISKDILNSAGRIPVVEEIESQVKEYSAKHDIPVYISGHPYIRTKVMVMTKTEIKIFIVLALLICIATLYIFFKSFKVIAVAITVVGIAVIWALGIMSMLDYRITILTAMIPPLLIVIGIPNTVYFLNKYHSETKRHGNKILALQRVIIKIGNAVFITNLTTAAAFATFIITNNSILVEFGIIASSGIIFIFLSALIIIPAIFSFLDPPSSKYTKHLDGKIVTKSVNCLVNIVTRHRSVTYTIFSIVIVVSIFGITLIKRTGFILDDVPHHSPIYTELKFLEKNFNGAFPMEFMIGSKDTLKGVDLVYQAQKLDLLQTKLRKYPELSKSMSVADAIKFLYQAYSRGNVDNYKLPSDLKTYETIMSRIPQPKTSENSSNQNQEVVNLDVKNLAKTFIDSSNTTTRISLNIEDIGTNRMAELLPKIKNDILEIFPEEKYSTTITGSTVLYFVGTTYLTENLFTSLLLAVLVIVGFMFWMFRHIRIVLISLIPNIFSMFVTAAIMGFFGVPIKVSTILVFSIAFGIAVDDTIHYLAKYRQELRINNWNIGVSVKNALKETGVSMIYTSVILLLGFSIFTASSFGGTVALGLLVSIALLVAMFSNLILLPSLLLTLEKYLNKKVFKEPSGQIYDEEDEIDLDELQIEE